MRDRQEAEVEYFPVQALYNLPFAYWNSSMGERERLHHKEQCVKDVLQVPDGHGAMLIAQVCSPGYMLISAEP